MRLKLDFALCIVAALGLHGLLLWRDDGASRRDAGEGGESVVTTVAGSEVASLVEEWDQAPEAVTPPDAPLAEPAPETPPEMDMATAEPVVRAAPPAVTPPPPPVEAPPDAALAAAPPPPAADPSAPGLPDPVTDPDVALSEATPVAPRPDQPRRPDAPTPPEPVFEAPDTAAPPQSAVAPQVAEAPPQRPERTAPKAVRKPAPQQQVRPTATARTGSAAAPSVAGQGETNQRARGTDAVTVSAAERDRIASLRAQYAAAVRSSIARNQRHPRSARGAEGVVNVALTVARGGAVISASVRKGSGVSALDEAALDAIRRVGTFPRAPDGLEGASFSFTIPMMFRR
ncbi:TonB family protein [Paroceanicella profunda]|uniref:TonB family protein n=1 Tax=Paroceanicella profunda TaxID=2579971 RepID=A0A5B8FVN1_9RHOB|nr:TonB family protein [Paroceanicella profunda]QDL91200.1 TonB family protein [Paroceanicella profunda]